ncbi:hypothetical protein [Rhodoferax sp.]|uniref:hypothetical protein n=1 Tax=Rhodoferax sp. TaxID=50421 RepID=UPI0026259198|nr:hypothetical protein [Rhodoferax sp.]MDD5479674.1 hypothetical protein [Rhodoferax sp.]
MISRVMPAQHSSGNGAIQIGKMGGGVTNVHLTQHIYRAPASPAAHQYAGKDVRLVLALLDQVPDRIAVLDFMEREFGTRMVIELSAPQVYRVRRYAEVILKNGGRT